MTDENQKPEGVNQEGPTKPDLSQAPAPAQMVDEKKALLQRANDVMGLNVHPNSSVETIRERIKQATEGKKNVTNTGDPQVDGSIKTADNEEVKLTPEQRNAKVRADMRKEQMALIRVRIANMNPAKGDLNGEIFTFGNRYLGTVRHFVPYQSPAADSWHLPRCIVNMLKAKQYQHISTKKGKGGADVPVTRWVREFQIEELEPLTEAQLKELARKQAAARGAQIDD